MALTDRNHFWALAGIGCIAVACAGLGVFQFARQSDLAAKAREESVVSSGFGARIHEIESIIVPNLLWDEAIRHLDNHFDRAWAQENIAGFFTANGDFKFAYVLNFDNAPIYAMQDGKDIPLQQVSAVTQAVSAIVQDVRRAEAARQQMHVSASYDLANPIQTSTPIWLDNRLYVVTATLVGGDFGHAQLTHPRAPVVLTAHALDDNFMALLERRFLLTGMHLHDGDARFETTDAHAPIADRSGTIIATIDWTPQAPGTFLMRTVMPWVLGLLALLLAATLLLYRITRRDAKKLLESQQRTFHMAYHDALTGLSNRAQFEVELSERLQAAAQAGSGFALLCLDLDRFKELNDAYGHAVGDELLREVAARLDTTVGKVGSCARLGGDEFAILVPPELLDQTNQIAESVVAQLSLPLSLSIGAKSISCSVGVALWTPDIVEPLELLRRADMALYVAKNEGRNCVRTYDSAMDNSIKALRRLKDDLKADLAAEKLTLVYQPQVRWSGEVVGFEALVRWTHHELGPISPTIFVPLAEEAGLIKILGEFTLRQAALDSLRWPGKKMAVNCSATQMQDPDFVQRAISIVQSAGAQCADIELEMTEGVLFNDEERATTTLNALHEAGFSIALDDFGTGFSSLSYLRRYPIDKIKIDRSFVVALGEDPRADGLLVAIVNLAKTLGMRVIAEGVETQEQWLRISSAGCQKIQGYIASRPLQANNVVDFLKSEIPVLDLPPSG
ncbi:MAG: EAL domain-containing protein, partial [Hyphomonadaceae bacterium]